MPEASNQEKQLQFIAGPDITNEELDFLLKELENLKEQEEQKVDERELTSSEIDALLSGWA